MKTRERLIVLKSAYASDKTYLFADACADVFGNAVREMKVTPVCVSFRMSDTVYSDHLLRGLLDAARSQLSFEDNYYLIFTSEEV